MGSSPLQSIWPHGLPSQNPRFSQDAAEYIERIEKRIILVDGRRLAELMIAHGVEVSDVTLYTVKRIDEDYFEE